MKSSFAENLMNLHRKNHIKTNERGGNCKIFKIKYVENSDPNRFLFYVVCSESWSNQNGWISSVLFEDAHLNTKRDTKKPLNSSIRVKCSCPAFQYWGSAYNSTNEDYNLDINEDREPNIRDPHRERKICKHLVKVRTTLRNTTFKKLRKAYSSVEEIVDEFDQLEEISWDQTIPSIIRFLETKGINKKQSKKLASVIDADNYVKFLEKYEVIVK